jgi:elongation factor 1-gamma
MSQLRIFSYLPNPRIWKATIAARLCEVDVEVRGGSPKELQSWLWDFDARPLSNVEAAAPAEVRIGRVGFQGTSLRKTDAFMEAHPFGTVPAAFSPDGTVGIFESNSIMRAVARLGESRFPLYGHGPYEASRVDSFLDASLVFARDAQIYLLALMSERVSPDIYSRACDGFTLSSGREFLVGRGVTLADICFVAEMSLFFNEKARLGALERQGLEPILQAKVDASFPRAMGHLVRLRKHWAFAPDVDPYLAKLERL